MQHLANLTNWEIVTPCNGSLGTSPLNQGKLTIGNLNSSGLSKTLVWTSLPITFIFKSRKEVSLSEVFALFNWSFSNSGLSMVNKSSRYREVTLNMSKGRTVSRLHLCWLRSAWRSQKTFLFSFCLIFSCYSSSLPPPALHDFSAIYLPIFLTFGQMKDNDL